MESVQRVSQIAVKPNAEAVEPLELPLQPASFDIWDKKYRLKTKDGDAVDADVEATYERVARALRFVESPGSVLTLPSDLLGSPRWNQSRSRLNRKQTCQGSPTAH